MNRKIFQLSSKFFVGWMVFIMLCCVATIGLSADKNSEKSDKKAAKIEMQIHDLKVELLQMYTYKEACKMGAADFTDEKAQRTSERQLEKAEKRSEKLIEKILKKKEQLASLSE